jgi:hypothetical protein
VAGRSRSIGKSNYITGNRNLDLTNKKKNMRKIVQKIKNKNAAV